MIERSLIKKSILYRLRFWIGYGLLVLALSLLLILAVTQTSGGISSSEQTSALKSASITIKNINSFMIIDLPYHMLQKISISLFGLNPISIKLPSVVIAFITSIGLVLVLRHWLQPRTSVITGAIAITSTPFIFLAQQGTPAIMLAFWPVIIMLLVISSVEKGKLRTLIFPTLTLSIALSLYTPLMIYVIIALVLSSLAHPYTRLVIRRKIPNPILISSIGLTILSLVPLIYSIIKSPMPAKGLLFSQADSGLGVIDRLIKSVTQFADISGHTIVKTGNLAPYFTLVVVALMCIGLFYLYKKRHTIQSYILFSWLAISIIVAAFNPSHPEVVFIPSMILAGMGIAMILNEWYRLFPQNPYARAFALGPIAILIGGIMITDATRYFYLYNYNSGLIQANSEDLHLMHSTLRSKSNNITPSFIAVSNDELPFYKLYIDTNKINLQVTTEGNIDKISTSDKTRILATKSSALAKSKTIPESVIASRLDTKPSDRFYIYKNIAK